MVDSLGGYNVSGPTVGFGTTIQNLILRNVIARLRGGLAYTPAGSIVPAVQKPGGSGTYTLTNWTDIEPDLTELAEVTPPGPTFLAGDNLQFAAKLIGQYLPVTWLATILAGEDLVAQSVETISRMAAEAYDLLARNVYLAATTDFWAGTSSNSTDDVVYTDILTSELCVDIVQALRANDVEPLPSGAYALVGHPLAFSPLLKAFADGTVNAASFGTVGDLTKGSIGRYLSLDFVPTSRGIVLTGAGKNNADIYKLCAIGKQALAMSSVGGNFTPIVRVSNDVSDPLGQIKATIGYKAFAGAALVKVANRSDGAGSADAQVARCYLAEVGGGVAPAA